MLDLDNLIGKATENIIEDGNERAVSLEHHELLHEKADHSLGLEISEDELDLDASSWASSTHCSKMSRSVIKKTEQLLGVLKHVNKLESCLILTPLNDPFNLHSNLIEQILQNLEKKVQNKIFSIFYFGYPNITLTNNNKIQLLISEATKYITECFDIPNTNIDSINIKNTNNNKN